MPRPVPAEYDIAVIGGGINGSAIARDAAGRGLRVLLVDMGDLASATSGASSKLIHGGLRYLEQGAFRLVREALTEREVLLRMAPHIIRPMRFLLPPLPEGRAPLKLRLGLLLYDWLGARKLLPKSATVDLTHNVMGQPLLRQFRYGFEYSDCWVDDARLVVLTARDAADRGAVVRPRTRLTRAERGPGMWDLVLNDHGRRDAVKARVLINATGPWIADVAEMVLRQPLKKKPRLIKGSHIVVRRRFDHDNGYILQAHDDRVVFALPFGQDFTMIGTTDKNFVGDPSSPAPDADEILYLCEVMNTYFRDKVTPDELVWSFAGVRALYDDGKKNAEDVTRDYELVLDKPSRLAPMMTVYGGKITTHRKLAESAMAKLSGLFDVRQDWTAGTSLPGGDFPAEGFYDVVAEAIAQWPFLSEPHARRIVRAYGRRIQAFLGDATSMDDLGPCFCGDLTGAELRYLVENEWAETADDVLWRRSKLGLAASPDDRIAINHYIVSLTHPPQVTDAPSLSEG